MNELQQQIYQDLGTQSRKAIKKTKAKYGKPYSYRPRGDLLRRLALKYNKTEQDIYKELNRIRKFLLAQQKL